MEEEGDERVSGDAGMQSLEGLCRANSRKEGAARFLRRHWLRGRPTRRARDNGQGKKRFLKSSSLSGAARSAP